ncbi:MAG: BON domain-containing protein [Bryobacteraceae bacterium]|nr:BON domain-containing protein [Bryobacteraceae bacterium]
MAERPDDRWTNEGMGDRGGAAERPRRAREHGEEGEQRSGYWSSRPSDHEAGYGGGRERAEEFSRNSFGETGWGSGRQFHPDEPYRGGNERPEPRRDFPYGPRNVQAGPGWDERYARENAGQHGESGGQPTMQRGASQSGGGVGHREQGTGNSRDMSPRGGYGIRETEHWGQSSNGPDSRPNHAGKGPKNYQRSDERISEDLCHRLTEHPGIDATHIEIQVRQGEVVLTGTLSDRRARYEAEEVAAAVNGVKDVQNQIRIG